MTQPKAGSPAITGLDHCILLVHDLNAARRRIERLGFQCAPRGVHSEHMGTHNHCVMLECGYFEVMAILHPTDHNSRWREVLARREGLSGVALRSNSARAAHEAFHAAGIDAPDPVDFSRPVELADGGTHARFTVTSLPDSATPGTSMFVCEHHTPELVWLPEYLTQPNRVSGLAGLTLVAPQPLAWREQYERLFGVERVRIDGENLNVDTGRGFIEMRSPAALATRFGHGVPDPSARPPYLAALSLHSADLDATGDFLDGAGVAKTRSDRGGWCVSPVDGCGAIFEFLAQPPLADGP